VLGIESELDALLVWTGVIIRRVVEINQYQVDRDRARDWLKEVIVELGDLETESELENEAENEEGYISSELSDVNDSDIEEMEAEDRVDEVVEGRVMRSGRMI
jgi:hypothetical protein